MTLVDTGTGNLFSLTQAFRREGADVAVSHDPVEIRRATCLVLPGVASFSAMVEGLRGVRVEILRRVREGVPLLGVCAGMQVLFLASEEGPGFGLGLLSERVRALPAPVLPHMGWSPLVPDDDPWLRGLAPRAMVYFAHSYAAPAHAPGVVATSEHGVRFAAAVRQGNVFGVQFHPEKSARPGALIIRGFLRESGVIPSA